MEVQQVNLSLLPESRKLIVAMTKHLNDIGYFAEQSDFKKISFYDKNTDNRNGALVNALNDFRSYGILKSIGSTTYKKYLSYRSFRWSEYPELREVSIGMSREMNLKFNPENPLHANLFFVSQAYLAQAEELKREMIPELMSLRKTGI